MQAQARQAEARQAEARQAEARQAEAEEPAGCRSDRQGGQSAAAFCARWRASRAKMGEAGGRRAAF